jgi:hypothetical protein
MHWPEGSDAGLIGSVLAAPRRVRIPEVKAKK